MNRSTATILGVLVLGWLAVVGARQAATPATDLDRKVSAFLEQHRYGWHDMNVPEADAQQLRDIVVAHGYRNALEIGTSTGRSGIWIAWGLAGQGGRLVTIEIDEGRHAQAVKNFQEAGLDAFIDARRGDAHDLVPTLDGPLDFVFIDADKDWYTNYAKAVIPRLRVGGCLAAHNVYAWGGERRGIGGEYYEYVTSLPYLETTVTSGGLSVSYKRRDK